MRDRDSILAIRSIAVPAPLTTALTVPSASESIRRTRVPAYVIAALTVLLPLMELAASGWPYRAGDPEWRIAMLAAGAAASTAVLLGLLLIYVAGTIFNDRLAIWLVAYVAAF